MLPAGDLPRGHSSAAFATVHFSFGTKQTSGTAPKKASSFLILGATCHWWCVLSFHTLATAQLGRMTAAAAQPTLTYWDRQPPLAAVALAKHTNVDLKHTADPKATKETIPTLRFASG